MSDTSTPANGGEPMRAVVENYGSHTTKADDIPADLKPYADQVLKMDHIRDVPGNVQMKGGTRAPISLKASSLSPELQSEVYRKLEAMPKMDPQDRAKQEHKFVQEAMEGQLGSIRAKTGLGPDALPFHKQLAEIAGRVSDLQRVRQTYVDGVDDIARLNKATDPVTGELVAEPVYRLSETRRANYRHAIEDIDHKIRLLVNPDGSPGIEGRKLLRKAHIESALLLQERDRVRNEEAAAQRLAAQNMADARIAKRAEAIARMRTSQ